MLCCWCSSQGLCRHSCGAGVSVAVSVGDGSGCPLVCCVGFGPGDGVFFGVVLGVVFDVWPSLLLLFVGVAVGQVGAGGRGHPCLHPCLSATPQL